MKTYPISSERKEVILRVEKTGAFKCADCSKEINTSCCYEFRGKVYCEDCYMDLLSPPKACDPWAVHSAATFLKGQDKFSALSPRQIKIVDYVKTKNEVTLEDLMKDLDLPEKELRREFATLRHMEILGATNKEGKILYTMFRETS